MTYRYGPEWDECREWMGRLDGMPAWHLQLPADLLTATGVGPGTKWAMCVLDGCARGSVSRASVDKLAERARCSPRAMRKRLAHLSELDYASRAQEKGRGWTTRLRRPAPAAWLPGFALQWWNSRLCPTWTTPGSASEGVQPELMIAWGLAIWNLPTRRLVAEVPTLGPWSEIPTRRLAGMVGVDHAHVPALHEQFADAGLGVVVFRGTGRGRVPAVYPMYYPWTVGDRDRHVSCLVDMLAEQDGSPALKEAAAAWEAVMAGDATRREMTGYMAERGVYGVDAPTVWEDTSLTRAVKRRVERTQSREVMA